MKRFYILLLAFLAIFVLESKAQSFTNGDLNGTIGISSLPTNWTPVPFTDPNSISTGSNQSTPDLCNTTGPSSGGGINGNPYSGNSFVSGLKGSGFGWTWHEGIMQTISGLTPGNTYVISMYQTVVKQSNALDQSGGWEVFQDNTLIGTTAPSFSSLAFNSNSLVWNQRKLTFTATSNSHTLKFLPWDDDANINLSSNSGVRMGIDSITLSVATVLAADIPLFAEIENEEVILSWENLNSDPYEQYFIDRSPNGYNFERISEMDGSRKGQFSFTDINPMPESFYRLGMKSADGNVAFSDVIQVEVETEPKVFVIGSRLMLEGGSPHGHAIEIFNLNGKQVAADWLREEMELEFLQSGIYLIKIATPGRAESVLIEKIKLK